MNDARFSAATMVRDAARAMRVRPARAEDRQALLALRCALWPQRDLVRHEHELSIRAQAGARHEVLLVEDEAGRACGFAEFTRDPVQPGEPGRVVLHALFVAPAARRRGAARRLLDAAERWAHRRGAVRLVCDLDPQDTDARDALGWLGFGEPQQRLRVSRKVQAPLEVGRAPALADPSVPVRRSNTRTSGRGLFVLVNIVLFACALVSFAYTDIFSRDVLRGVLLPLLDAVLVLWFLGVGLAWRYRRRTDAGERADRLFR